ncbi:MAG TPA: DUF2267 domain-containing protein [Streptosporangiaceae bacterium]
MDQKELVGAIAARTSLTREEAGDVTRAVLDGLAGQLSEGEARRLAGDLPGPLAREMQASPRRRPEAHPTGIDDFIRQVSERTGLTSEDTRDGAGAVLATLRDALSGDDYRHLVGQLPDEYAELAETAG